MMEMKIGSEGSARFVKQLADLKDAIPAIISRVTMTAAGIVTDEARPTIPRVSGDAARSLRHYLTNGGGAEVEGGSTIDYYRWLELGGASGRKLSNKRPEISDGRYIYPAYVRNENKITTVITEEFTRAIQESGLGVT